MTRARIAALVLVNWKGVFYERYLLDRHVTALEGANGAGKTTVMIAAYVALLPDMSRLRFTNLGETAATGGDRGIWGRLGESGRPSYTVLDLDLGGERMLLGVRLTRASEPTIEATTFVIRGLPEAVRLSEILLVRRDDADHVPELAEIKAAVAAVGGNVEVFRSVKDYFALLFDRGILPLRLALEDERSKWNDLLRTSMTGGISRALTSELRSFVLKEETGLGDTLSRMRANLEACRRTRVEVFESRQLEREISAIYEAGLGMFAAALQATRAAAHEAEARASAAARVEAAAEQARAELEQAESELAQREAAHEARGEALRAGVQQLMAAGERGQAAAACAERNAGVRSELERHAGAVEAALSAQRERDRARADAKAERARALEAYDRASVGLAHAQRGLDELHRRAHAARRLHQSLAEARALLEDPQLEASGAVPALARVEQERAGCETERAAIDREARDLAVRREEHARALAALARLEEVAVADTHAPQDAFTRARTWLARIAEQERSVADPSQLERELREAERLAARQQAACELADSLALASADAEGVARALEDLERAVREAEARLAAAHGVHAQPEAEALWARLAALDDRTARFRLATSAAARVVGEQAAPTSQREVLALRDQITEREQALGTRRQTLEREREALQRTAAEMAEGGSRLDPELVRLSRELGAELLAARFEDVESSSAGWLEARLGPLVQALLVDDPEVAVEALGKLEHARTEVLLVRAHTALALTPPSDAAEARAVVCQEPFGVRVTRVPERPTLGRRAREQELAELHASLERYGAALDELHADAQRLAAQRRDADVLLAHVEVLAAGDPAADRARIGEELAKLEQAQVEARTGAAAARAELVAARPRLSSLRRLLPEAHLLAAPDYAERARELSQRHQQLTAAKAELARLAAPREQLAELLDVLRQPPPDDDALAAKAARAGALDLTRERLFRARAALEEVAQHAYAEAFGDPQAMLAALEAEVALTPALEQQHAAARAAVQAADAAERAAEQAWEAATAAFTRVNAERAVLAAQLERGEVELAALGPPPSAAELGHAVHELERARGELTQLEREQRAEVAERARTAERRAQAERELSRARSHTAAISGEAAPLAAAWQALRAEVEARGLAYASARDENRSSSQLRAEAASKRELLCDRLARARGGEELRALLEQPEEQPDQLQAWQAVREWLRRRVPAQIAEVDDPLLALERLRDHLSVLEGRLQRQEGDLRGASEDVARGVDVQLRRAQAQVRRLNQQLDGIRFGSVHGIRVEMRRIERMEQILRALRAGEAQELLFSSSLPIEEALEEIFKRFGGGGKSGGQQPARLSRIRRACG